MPPAPPTLPVAAVLDDLTAAVRAHGAAVLVAPPGSGKTTLVPGALLDGGLAGDGRVVLLQPRRVAARLSARWIARQRRTEVGAEVGYSVRFDRRCGPETRIEVATVGVLLRRLQAEPFLDGEEPVGAVILDEFHERSLDMDLCLGLLQEVRQAGREDLALVIMSATMDAEPVATALGGAPILRSGARQHPVEVRHLPRTPALSEVPAAVAAAVRQSLSENDAGHVLAFLPGTRSIERTGTLLGDLGAGFTVAPLHGRMSPEDQDLAVQGVPGDTRRRVVLATNVAETSVTVPGVRAVVDSGLRKRPVPEPRLGLTRLVVQPISRASADQRAGRAGRTGPGRCLRLWAADAHGRRAAQDPPEVATADLAAAVLRLACWGVDPAAFGWLDAPPAAGLARARADLVMLGALEETGGSPRPTALGRTMDRLPLAPRLARVVVEGHRLGCIDEACAAAALVSEVDPWLRPPPPGGATLEGGLLDRIERVRAALTRPRHHEPDVRPGAWHTVVQVTRQLRRGARDLGPPAARADDPEHALLKALIAGFPDRVALRRAPGSPTVLLASGAEARLGRSHRCPRATLMVAVDLRLGQPRHPGAPLPLWVELATELPRSCLPASQVQTRVVHREDAAGQAIEVVSQERFGALVLDEKPAPHRADPEQVRQALVALASRAPAAALQPTAGALALLGRLRLVARLEGLGLDPEALAPWTQDHLDDTLRALLPELCRGRRSLDQLARLDLESAILDGLDWKLRQAIDRLAPVSLPVSTGARVRLSYPWDGPPVLAARLQQLFGMERTPTVGEGRVPVLVHLLAPNRRVVQITQDLAGFWAGSWQDVRRDLRGRYPKHAWPEVPTAADAQDRPRRKK